jgi:putative transposase
MKLIAQIKLMPTEAQAAALKNTLEIANAACNHISIYAWDNRTFGKFNLQKALYHPLKQEFGLSAQMVVRCFAKVSDAYALDKKTRREFRPLGSIAYDDRILSFKLDKSLVSIWTIGGRCKISFVAGDKQRQMLKTRQGESDLVYREGEFYLFVICNIEEEPAGEIIGFLGVDLGIKNIAADSTGETYAGNHLNSLRKRHAKLRAKLQAKQTKGAKRLLKKRRRKEQRMAANVNHVISKRIVAKAKDTGFGIALEDLKGIRERVTVRKASRRQQSSWAFADLRAKITYKAQLAGVPMVLIDPRNTSRECAACGHIDKANRKSQSSFLCVVCGFVSNADLNAAVIISRRAAVNRPNVSTPFVTRASGSTRSITKGRLGISSRVLTESY